MINFNDLCRVISEAARATTIVERGFVTVLAMRTDQQHPTFQQRPVQPVTVVASIGQANYYSAASLSSNRLKPSGDYPPQPLKELTDEYLLLPLNHFTVFALISSVSSQNALASPRSRSHLFPLYSMQWLFCRPQFLLLAYRV